jgi:hypothetical protein
VCEKNKGFKIEFTYLSCGGKWVGYGFSTGSGLMPEIFNTIEDARERCKAMGPVYFACGDNETRWMQRILNVETGEEVERVHELEVVESEQESV